MRIFPDYLKGLKKYAKNISLKMINVSSSIYLTYVHHYHIFIHLLITKQLSYCKLTGIHKNKNKKAYK